jgi:hypothetical protein
MPRRTYDPRNGRRRPYHGMGADWARALLQLLNHDRQDRVVPRKDTRA